MKWPLRFLKVAYVCLIASLPVYAFATNYAVTQGSGTTFGSLVVSAVNYAQQLVCDPTTPTQCAAVSAGGAVSVAGPVTNAGTFAVQSTQTGTWTMQPGNTANTVPWLQIIRDAAGNARGANVNASNQLSVSCDNGCTASTAITGWAGGTLGAMANYGTSPGSVLVPGVNAFVTNTNANGQATMANSSPVAIASNQSNLPVINGASRRQAVAASQTDTVLQSSSGATGDYLSHCVIYPTSTSPGAVTVFDNTNTAANSAVLFAGGASSTSNLTPIAVPVGAVSLNGAWKVTTGSAVSVVCYGKFS